MAMYNFKHGMIRTSAYGRWQAMISRCYCKTNPKYKRYGGRGIKVCDEWHEFLNFYRDMGDPPAKHTLDRIDNNGNYQPGNCRWASQKKQQNNRENNFRVEFEGVTLTVTQWSEISGVPAQIIKQRIKRDGLSVRDAIFKTNRINSGRFLPGSLHRLHGK